MKKNFLSENFKNILISAIGAFTCIFLIAYFNSIDKTNLWLIPPFGASLVLAMALPNSPLARPKNIILGHVIAASAGVITYQILGNNPLSIGIALGLAIYLMLITDTTHPPAGANPVLTVLGGESFDFILMPVALGAIFIVAFSITYNRLIAKS